MTPVSLPTKQTQTHRQSRPGIAKAGSGEGWPGSLRVADTNSLHREWINIKAQHSIQNSVQYPVIIV